MASTANRHAPSEQASLDRLLDDFLADHEQVVNWNVFAGRPIPLVPRLVFLGRGEHPLEVALASAALGRPKVDDVRRLWAERHANRPASLLLVVAYPDGDEARATLCGPVGDAPPVESGLDLSQVERLCAAALREPSRHAAVRLLAGMLDGLRAELIPVCVMRVCWPPRNSRRVYRSAPTGGRRRTEANACWRCAAAPCSKNSDSASRR